MPLRVQKLFDEYNNPGSFAVASLLTSLALLTLFAKVWLERKTRREMAAGARAGAIDPSALVESAIVPGAIIPSALVGNVPIAGELPPVPVVRVPVPHVSIARIPIAPVPVSREIP